MTFYFLRKLLMAIPILMNCLMLVHVPNVAEQLITSPGTSMKEIEIEVTKMDEMECFDVAKMKTNGSQLLG